MIGPTPGWSKRWGATDTTSSTIDALRPPISVVSARTRLSRLRSTCLVAVSLTDGSVAKTEGRAFGYGFPNCPENSEEPQRVVPASTLANPTTTPSQAFLRWFL